MMIDGEIAKKKSWKRVKYVRQNSEGLNVGLMNKIRNLRLIPWRLRRRRWCSPMTNSLFSSRCDFRFSFEIAKKIFMYIFFFAKKRAYFTSSKVVEDNKSQISTRSSESLKTSRRCRHFATEKKDQQQKGLRHWWTLNWLRYAHSLSTPPPHETSTTAK